MPLSCIGVPSAIRVSGIATPFKSAARARDKGANATTVAKIPSWTVPGGVNSPLDTAKRDRILAGLPAAKATALRTLDFFKGIVDKFSEEIAAFGNSPTMYAGLVDDNNNLQLYDGNLRFVDAAGDIVVDRMPAKDYAQYIGEATVPHSFLKSPYFKPRGFPEGTYRVGPLARLNVIARCGTEAADIEFDEYHQRFGKVVQSAFHFITHA